MNYIALLGRLSKDPETRTTPQGMEVVRFTIACDRYTKDGNKADFIQCTAFGKTAETIGKYFTKGKPILAVGSIRNDNYEKDGKTVYRDTIVIDKVEFVPENKDTKAEAKPKYEGFTQLSEEDIPF